LYIFNLATRVNVESEEEGAGQITPVPISTNVNITYCTFIYCQHNNHFLTVREGFQSLQAVAQCRSSYNPLHSEFGWHSQSFNQMRHRGFWWYSGCL